MATAYRPDVIVTDKNNGRDVSIHLSSAEWLLLDGLARRLNVSRREVARKLLMDAIAKEMSEAT